MEKKIEITEEEKKEYLRCLLGRRRFTKTYEILPGAFVKFRSLTTKDANLFTSAEFLFSAEELKHALRMLFYVDSVLDKKVPIIDKQFKSSDEIEELYYEYFGDIDHNLYSLIAAHQVKFIDTLEILASEMLNKDF